MGEINPADLGEQSFLLGAARVCSRIDNLGDAHVCGGREEGEGGLFRTYRTYEGAEE